MTLSVRWNTGNLCNTKIDRKTFIIVYFVNIENNGFMINVEIYNKKDNIQLIISKGNKSNVDLSILEKQIINKWKELK